MQLYYNCLRSPNSVMLAQLGPDTGFDCIGPHNGAAGLAAFLDTLSQDAAWWFNDSLHGMREHMTSLASLSLLGNFVGMLTDSRSFLSYARHEYFRRILCDLLGGWMEEGLYPDDLGLVGGIVQDICYRNAKKYFQI